MLGVDPRDDLDVRLEARAAQLGRQQLVDLEDPRRAQSGVAGGGCSADMARTLPERPTGTKFAARPRPAGPMRGPETIP